MFVVFRSGRRRHLRNVELRIWEGASACHLRNVKLWVWEGASAWHLRYVELWIWKGVCTGKRCLSYSALALVTILVTLSCGFGKADLVRVWIWEGGVSACEDLGRRS